MNLRLFAQWMVKRRANREGRKEREVSFDA